MASIPGSGRSPGEGHGNPLQYTCLENPMDRGAWRAAAHGFLKSQTRLKCLSTHRVTGGLQSHQESGFSFIQCQEGSQVLALSEHPNVEDRVPSPVLHYLADFPHLAFGFSVYDRRRLDQMKVSRGYDPERFQGKSAPSLKAQGLCLLHTRHPSRSTPQGVCVQGCKQPAISILRHPSHLGCCRRSKSQ